MQTVSLLGRRRNALSQHQTDVRSDTIRDSLVLEVVDFRRGLVERLAERQDRVDVCSQHLIALVASQVAQLDAAITAGIAIALARGNQE